VRDMEITLTAREKNHVKWLTQLVPALAMRRTPTAEYKTLLVDTLTYSDRENWPEWEEPE
jgi:hypothetical protein